MPDEGAITPRRVFWDAARRPAVLASACFIVGIFAHPFLPHHPAAWVIAVAILSLASAVIFKRGWTSSLLLIPTLIFAGVATAQVEAYFYPANHIGTYATDDLRIAQLELSIDEPPRLLTNAFGQYRAIPPKQVVTARAVKVRTWSGWADTCGDVLVQIDQPHPRLDVGQRVRVFGQLQRPAPAMNPGQFDWADYYREQRILASLKIAHSNNIEILSTSSWPGATNWLRQQSRRALAAGFPARASLDHALLRALLLGDSDPELRDVQEQFKRTGTSHHLAISGMHVAVLGGFVFLICRLLCLPPRISAWVMLIFVVLYGVAALPSPPVVRSVILCVAFCLGIVYRRSLDPIQLLAVSVLAMLAYHPLDLYNAGFQLSFGTVLGLMLFAEPLIEHFGGQRERDRKVSRQFTQPTQREALADWRDRTILTTGVAGLVAWGVSFPLIAFHFQQLNPWAVVGSIVLAPIVFLAMLCGLMKVVLTLLWPSLAGAWASVARWPVLWMRHVVDWLAKLPSADVPSPPPSLWVIAIYYALLVVGLRSMRPGSRWVWLAAMIFFGASIIILPLRAHIARPLTSAGELRVTLLAVGAGQCCVVEPPGGHVVLIDAGSASLTDLLRKCLGPYLRTRGQTDVDKMFISHANYDHFSSVAEVTSAYDAREILVAPEFRASCDGNPPAEALLTSLDNLDRPPRVVLPGDQIPLGKDTTIDVLWPPKDSAFDANNTSLVIKLTHAGKSILFTGDIQADAERALLKNPEQLHADVLVAPHHGSSERSTEAFVRAVAPSAILSSNDRTLTTKQREFEKMIGKCPLYRTNREGAITVKIDAKGSLVIESFLHAPGR